MMRHTRISTMRFRRQCSPVKSILTKNNIWIKQMVGFCCRTFFYDNMSISPNSSEVHGQGMITAQRGELSKLTFETKWKAYTRRLSSTEVGDEYTVCIFPVPCCKMSYIDDSRYDPDEARPRHVERIEKPGSYHHNDVQLRDFDKPANRFHFLSFNVVPLIASENIPARSELFVSYGEMYMDI